MGFIRSLKGLFKSSRVVPAAAAAAAPSLGAAERAALISAFMEFLGGRGGVPAPAARSAKQRDAATALDAAAREAHAEASGKVRRMTARAKTACAKTPGELTNSTCAHFVAACDAFRLAGGGSAPPLDLALGRAREAACRVVSDPRVEVARFLELGALLVELRVLLFC